MLCWIGVVVSLGWVKWCVLFNVSVMILIVLNVVCVCGGWIVLLGVIFNVIVG